MKSAIILLAAIAYSFGALANDQTVFFNVNDPTAKINPVRKVDATKLSVDEALSKIGKIKLSQSISLICNGYNPKASYLPLAFDVVTASRPSPIMDLVDGTSKATKLCEIKQAAIK